MEPYIYCKKDSQNARIQSANITQRSQILQTSEGSVGNGQTPVMCISKGVL